MIFIFVYFAFGLLGVSLVFSKKDLAGVLEIRPKWRRYVCVAFIILISPLFLVSAMLNVLDDKYL